MDASGSSARHFAYTNKRFYDFHMSDVTSTASTVPRKIDLPEFRYLSGGSHLLLSVDCFQFPPYFYFYRFKLFMFFFFSRQFHRSSIFREMHFCLKIMLSPGLLTSVLRL